MKRLHAINVSMGPLTRAMGPPGSFPKPPSEICGGGEDAQALKVSGTIPVLPRIQRSNRPRGNSRELSFDIITDMYCISKQPAKGARGRRTWPRAAGW